jgi:hypothetical protein
VDTSNVEQFNLERDLESTIKAFVEVFNITDETQIENLRNQLNTLEDLVDTIHAQSVIREGDKMAARQLMYSPKSSPEDVILGQVIAVGDNSEENTKKVIAKNIAIAKEKGLGKLTFSIFGNFLKQEEDLSAMGFTFEEDLTMFKKDL